MRVKIEYKNRNLKTIGTEVFDFDMYCGKLSQDTLGILSDIELLIDQLDIEDDFLYRRLRHRIMDLSGALKRLPENIIKESVDKKEHLTKSDIVSAIRE